LLEEEFWLSSRNGPETYAFAPKIFSQRYSNTGNLEKAYFQLSELFYNHLTKHVESSYHSEPVFARLCDHMIDVQTKAKTLLLQTAETISGSCDVRSSLNVLVKVLLCEPSTHWSTSPHYDRSVLTLAIGADDLEEEGLGFWAYGNENEANEISNLALPRVGSPGGNAAVVFPGMAMRESGISALYPTLHAATPASRRRHSLVAFLVDLNIDSNNLLNLKPTYQR
jgi:hypothetical protein